MADHTLTQVWKNEIREVMEGHGLNPREFKWGTHKIKGSLYSILMHRQKSCYFKFCRHKNALNATWCEYRPAEKSAVNQAHIEDSSLAIAIQKWVLRAKVEVAAPDTWAELQAYSLSIPESAGADLDSAPLLEADKKRVRLAAAQVKENAEAKKLRPEQLAVINKKLDYIVASSERFGLKDWVHVALSALMMMAADAQLQADVYKEIIAPFIQLIESGVRLLGS